MATEVGKRKSAVKSTPEHVRKMVSLAMPSRNVTKGGTVYTVVSVHPAWRRCGFAATRIYAALPENN